MRELSKWQKFVAKYRPQGHSFEEISEMYHKKMGTKKGSKKVSKKKASKKGSKKSSKGRGRPRSKNNCVARRSRGETACQDPSDVCDSKTKRCRAPKKRGRKKKSKVGRPRKE